jgi:hypothetical protein
LYKAYIFNGIMWPPNYTSGIPPSVLYKCKTERNKKIPYKGHPSMPNLQANQIGLS